MKLWVDLEANSAICRYDKLCNFNKNGFGDCNVGENI